MPDASSRSDTIFKVLAIVSSLIVIPTFGWVWSTQGNVGKMEVELTTLKAEMAQIRENNTQIQIIKNDITHIRTSLVDIKHSLKELAK
jgi:hypothetical protein